MCPAATTIATSAHVKGEPYHVRSLSPFAPQLNVGTSFYKRSFVEEVRKCDDLTRIMRCIEEELDEAKAPPHTHTDTT